MSATSSAQSPGSTAGGIVGGLGTATNNTLQGKNNPAVDSFLNSLVASIVVFSVQVIVFLLIKSKLPRIYNPRSYLVSERERVAAPQTGLWRWAVPVFQTSNSEFIQKCGLDAYFFLRYLRMLLKIFIPLAALLLPILLPINVVGGRGDNFPLEYPYNKTTDWNKVVGFDKLAWGNVRPTDLDRYWAHLFMAIIVVAYCCYVFFDELRGYVRLRQAYLTSPQHRLRASATTVLVSGIPRKWCTAEALDGLYDVFPGGIRNIWINRNFDVLNDKVKLRKDIATKLEEAQSNLIKNAKKAHIAELEKVAKKSGLKRTKREKVDEQKQGDLKAAAMAEQEGTSTGDPHQVQHLDQALYGDSPAASQPSINASEDKRPILPLPIPVVGKGVEAVGTGITTLGKTVFGGIKNVGREVDNAISTTQGFDLASDNQNVLGKYENRLDGADFGGSGDRQLESEKPVIQEDKASRDISQPLADNDSLHDNDPHFGEKNDGLQTDSKRPGSSDSRKVNTVPLHGRTKYAFWRQSRNAIDVPDPYPHGYRPGDGQPEAPEKHRQQWWEFWKSDGPVDGQYPEAYDKEYDPNEDNALWKKYVKPKDRDTMRLPIFGQQWLSWLPFVGKKVDTIDYCRKELARLNLEIEHDQKEPEKYPLMNSAFIQFNHQVAAHMACQAVSHHIPMQMAPRAVEVSPDDVLWNNMSIRWWEKWIRTFLVVLVVVAMVIGWAPISAFSSALYNINSLSVTVPWLSWLKSLPSEAINIVQGILPVIIVAIVLALAPLVLMMLARLQGVATGTMSQLAVSWYCFAFFFMQVFLIVTVAGSLTNALSTGQFLTEEFNLTYIPNLLANSIPSTSNYFFSYLLLQAMSISAGVLVQVISLLGWFILGPIFDSTARQKWQRQVNLPTITWGTFFPIYTNLACIGLIYSTITPLILVFLIITFGLFWFAYRYQTLYITRFKHDTGGLLFPKAINQLFVGLYVMELCLIGLYTITSSVNFDTGKPVPDPRVAQAVIMAVVLIFTIIFQVLLNRSFGPLFRYLPITLEDDAVIRDEEFARAQDKRLHLAEDEREGDDIADVLEERERRSEEENRSPEDALEMQDLPQRSKSRRLNPLHLAAAVPGAVSRFVPGAGSWATRRDSSRRRTSRSRSRNRRASHKPTDAANPSANTTEQENWVFSHRATHARDVNAAGDALIRQHRLRKAASQTDPEAAPHRAHDPNAIISEALFAGINDEIEDLTPEERDILVRRAFQHEALRARRPVIWIPRDDLGVSDDEIRRTKRLTGSNVWISNEHTGLDGKGRVVYRKSPPDFSELDLIVL